MERQMTIRQEVSKSVGKILETIERSDVHFRKALLAKLRQSISKPFSQSMPVWSCVLANVPESFLGIKNGAPSKEFIAIINTLQIYALYESANQISEPDKNICELEESEDTKDFRHKTNMGSFFKELRQEQSTRQAADSRFNNMIVSREYENFFYRLRQLIRLFKSKQRYKLIDYRQLAEDLYGLQFENSENIRIKWGYSYYK